MMPRLLLIAYHYPPENTSGAARPARLARYLPEAGVECRVIARGSPEPVTEADAPAYQRWLCEKVQRFLLPYNERLPWLPAAVRAGSDLIRRERIDALYSTSPPLVTHLVAMELSRRFGLPWLADFRDPLVGNPWRRRRFRQYDPWLERRIFDRAALCLANTDSLADEWRKAHPAQAEKIRVLWNGYDPEAPVAEPVPQAGGPRTLLHAGSLYGFRRPGPLVRALARLAGEGRVTADQWRLVLLGPLEPEVFDDCRAERERLESAGLLRVEGRLASREEAAAAQSSADVLVILDNSALESSMQVPAKLFEYVRTGQPILAWTPEGSPTRRLLERCGLDTLTLRPNLGVEETAEALAGFLARPLFRRPMSDWFREQFDGRLQAQALARDIRGVLR